MSQDSNFALGFIETQGFTAVFAAIDTACKAASVEIVGKEKLGGGYVTVVLKGDVASVKAAIEAGKVEVESLGKLIAAHVIPRPSPSVLGLLPQIAPPGRILSPRAGSLQSSLVLTLAGTNHKK